MAARFVLVAAVLGIAGCEEPISGASCDQDSDCSAEQSCREGRCVGCGQTQCAEGERCAAARCYPAACPQERCGTGAVCDQGACVDERCLALTCPAGERCARGACLPTQCSGTACDERTVCVSGSCVAVECAGVDCPSGTECAKGECLPTTCAGARCPDGAVCAEGSCVAAACVNVVCEVGERCAGGQCLPQSCPGQPCGPREVCQGATCVDAACVGVGCGDAAVCLEGHCWPTSCPTGPCAGGAVCWESRCVEPACAGVLCESGSSCVGGACARCGDQPFERACGDRTDEDCDELVDCADPDCAALPCGPPGAVCVGVSCQPPTCTDGYRNGGETGPDCGGPDCAACRGGQGCLGQQDCASGLTCDQLECKPEVGFASAEQTAVESVGAASVEVTLSATSVRPVRVRYSLGGTATPGVDHGLSAGELVIAAGTTSAVLTVPLVDDCVDEEPELLIVTLASPVGATLGAQDRHTLTLEDDDSPPEVRFAAAASAASEAAGSASVEVTLSAASSQDVAVSFGVAGTAAFGVDHRLAAGELIVPAGATFAQLTVPLLPDALDEDDETIAVTLLSATGGATIGLPDAHLLTVEDDDASPLVQFAADTQVADEWGGSLQLTAALSALSAREVQVPLSFQGSATAGEDYLTPTAVLTIPAGSLSGAVELAVLDDSRDELDETVVARMGTPLNATLGALATQTVTILDDDLPPAVRFAAPTQSISETVGTASVLIELSSPSDRDVSVAYSVSGTAQAGGVDHRLANGRLTIPASSLSVSLSFEVVNDALSEAAETIVLTLSSPTNAMLGAPSTHTLTIVDDDSNPTVSFTRSAQLAPEAAGAVSLAVRLSVSSGQQVTVPYTVSGTAGPADHDLTNGSLVLQPGQTSGAITLHLADDALDEADETVVIALGTPANAALGSPAMLTLTIADDDAAPQVEFAVDALTVSESVGAATALLSLSAPSGMEIHVPYSVGGTAASGDDHGLAAGEAVIPPGVATFPIAIPVIADVIDEDDETVVLNVGSPQNATLGAVATFTLTITDDDAPPSVAFWSAAQSVGEAAGSIAVRVILSRPSGRTVIAPYSVGGTATAGGVDHRLAAGSLTLAAGATEAEIVVPVVDDALDEAAETVVLTLGTPTNATLGARATHTLTIDDDDAAPSVSFASGAQSVSESVGVVSVDVRLSAASAQTVSVAYSVSGSASAGADHNASGGTLTFSPGTTSRTVSFTVTNDSVAESSETVALTLGSPANATLGTPATHTVTIGDDDAAPTVSFGASAQSAAESAGTVSVAITLSTATGVDVSVPLSIGGTASAGADHNLGATSATITAGSTSAALSFTLVNDALDEENETLTITLGTPSNAVLGVPGSYTLTITDDDPLPALSFTAASSTVGESSGRANLAVQLSAVSGRDVSVPYTVSGTAGAADHDLVGGVLSILAGSTTVSGSFNVFNDALDEANETVVVTLGAPTNATLGAQGAHTVTITDDDAAPAIAFALGSQTAGESATGMSASVSLSAASGLAVSVPYTVSGTASGSGVDHSLANGTVSIAAGSTSSAVAIPLVNDALDEANETVVLTLGTPSNATLGAQVTHTLTVTDDDPTPTVQFAAASQAVAEAVGTVTVTLQLSAASGLGVSVPYTVGGTASSADHNLASGTATISAGLTSTAVTFAVTNDVLSESSETVVLTLGTPANAGLGTRTVHTVTITDDDALPTVAFASAGQSVAENVGAVSVGLTLSAAAPAAVSIPFTVSGTAGAADHTLASGTATIAAGGTSTNIGFTVTNDALDEGDEAVVITLGAPTGATLGAQSMHTATITDDDPTPTVAFSAASQSAGEAVGTAWAIVQLSAASGLDVSVPFTVSGSAASGSDHTRANGTATILAGATSASIAIALLNDGLDEPNETVVLNLGTPTNAGLGTQAVHTVTIVDDDPGPVVQLASAAQTVGENVGTVTVGFTLSAASGQLVTVPFTVGGTATAGADHDFASGSLTLLAGVTSAAVSFTVVNDTAVEGSETVVVTLGAPTNATLGATTAHTVTISDDDASPLVAFAAPSQVVGEAAGAVSAALTLSSVRGVAVTVPYTVSGTATGADHTLVSGTATIPAGATSAAIGFSTTNDAIAETDETVVITLGAPTNATLGSPATHTLTIADDDGMPAVGFAAASQTVAEGVGTVTLGVSLSGSSAQAVSVPYTVAGTAGAGDHNLVGATLTIAAGATSGSISFAVTNDAAAEGTETVIVTLGTPTNAVLGAQTSHTVSIADDDSSVSVRFQIASQEVAESAGTASVVVVLSSTTGLTVSVPYTVSGTATSADRTLSNGTATISAGTTSTTISVPIINDTLLESAETVVLTLGAPTHATLAAPTAHTLTIADDEAATRVSFNTASSNTSERYGAASVTVVVSATGTRFDVPYTVSGSATNPSDHNLAAGTLSFQRNSTSEAISFDLVDDTRKELPETVIITLGAPTGGVLLGSPFIHTVTIADDDPPPWVEFASQGGTVGENAGTVSVALTLSEPLATSTTATFGVAGSAVRPDDHGLAPGTVTFPAGATTASISVPIVNDALAEGGERISLFLTGASSGIAFGKQQTTYVGIRDNDGTTLTRVDKIAGGSGHACAIVDGGLKCWGHNHRGQLGVGTRLSATKPVPVPTLASGVTDVSAGYDFTCAIASGSLKCWGDGTYGRLGNGSSLVQSSPSQVTGLTSDVTAVAAGAYHACAIVGGAVRCWGNNSNGQLGNNATTSSYSPVAVQGIVGTATAVAVGHYHSCAIADGVLYCWGRGTLGQIGDGGVVDRWVATAVGSLGAGVQAVAAGGYHNCAIASGALYCWGYNLYSSLGLGDDTDRSTPTLVAGVTSPSAVAATSYSSCAIQAGAAKCWGNNATGNLGQGDYTTRSTPTVVSGLASGVTLIAMGWDHSCAVASGALRCWGSDLYGQLGIDGHPSGEVPTATAGLGASVSSLVGTDSHALILDGGRAQGWGLNSSYQLGDQTTHARNAPVDVLELGGPVSAVSAGTYHSCAVLQSGAVQCWGSNSYGQLGDGTTAASRSPVYALGISGATAVSTGLYHTCAVASGGVYCWGYNYYGQVGDGTATARYVPTPVSGMSTGASAVAVGSYSSCALVAGAVRCWGQNTQGQLGDGTGVNASTPVSVAGISTAVDSISSGTLHACAVSGGALFCWGDNAYMQIGNGSTVDVKSALALSAMTSGVTAVAAGATHTCASQSGGLKCWGSNVYGQLGTLDFATWSTPHAVTGLSSGVGAVIAAGEYFSCAVANGQTLCWGEPTRLAPGVARDVSLPVEVLDVLKTP